MSASGAQRSSPLAARSSAHETVGTRAPNFSAAMDAKTEANAEIGTAELNAAISGMRAVCGTVSPLFWAAAFRAFAQFGRGTWYYSPGGTFLMCALLRRVVQRLVTMSCKELQ